MELIARVKFQLRRYTLLGGAEERRGILQTGGLALDVEAKELRVDGEVVQLTATEYGIVLFLMKNMGKVFSIDEVNENV